MPVICFRLSANSFREQQRKQNTTWTARTARITRMRQRCLLCPLRSSGASWLGRLGAPVKIRRTESRAHPATPGQHLIACCKSPTHYSACIGDGVLRREKGAQNAEFYQCIYAEICHSTQSAAFLERHRQLHRQRCAYASAIRSSAWLSYPPAGGKKSKRGACVFRRGR